MRNNAGIYYKIKEIVANKKAELGDVRYIFHR